MEKTTKGCKHDFKTLQQQIMAMTKSKAGGICGLLQCKKCLALFEYGPEKLGGECYITPTKVKEQ